MEVKANDSEAVLYRAVSKTLRLRTPALAGGARETAPSW